MQGLDDFADLLWGAQAIADYIGKSYRRQDELGTPYAVTVDFDSIEDHAVTVRERDSMEQERIAIADLIGHLRGRLA